MIVKTTLGGGFPDPLSAVDTPEPPAQLPPEPEVLPEPELLPEPMPEPLTEPLEEAAAPDTADGSGNPFAPYVG